VQKPAAAKPERLLSSIATTLFEMLAGLWLRTRHAASRKATMLAIVGVVFLCLGWACAEPAMQLDVPMNSLTM